MVDVRYGRELRRSGDEEVVFVERISERRVDWIVLLVPRT